MPFTEDLSDFINDDTPGYVDANITGIGIVGGIFGDDYGEFNGMVAGSKPTLLCISSEITTVVNGAALTIDGVDYTVAGAPQPDGTGLTILNLSET